MIDFYDGGLLRVLLQGPKALPSDVEQVGAQLAVIEKLLAEHAQETESDIEMEEARQSEVETLIRLEEQIAEHTVGLRADNLRKVMSKLGVWQLLAESDYDSYEFSVRDRIVHSICLDLQAIVLRGRCSAHNGCAVGSSA